MAHRLKVGVVFGGQSVEHQVSLLSAKTVIQALDKAKYELALIGIDTQGQWSLYDAEACFCQPHDPKHISLNPVYTPIEPFTFIRALDVVFPVLHGALGEDGTIQGLCRLAQVAFVGADVLSSALGMDKVVMKRLLKEQNIPVVPSLTVDEKKWSANTVLEQISLPFFVKPSNGGSSLGVSKVKEASQCKAALQKAFLYDSKIIVEEAVVGREIQVGVIGNEHPKVSLPCEIIPKGEFHSYESKYIDPDGALFIYPADVEMGLYLKMRALALKTYHALCCEGMARVDFFLKNSGQVFVNEINTIPGLTNRSPFAKMWQVSGIEYPDLLDQLIAFALEAQERRQKKMFSDFVPYLTSEHPSY